jgi:uncharacterized protein YjiS (DUF1127 family)
MSCLTVNAATPRIRDCIQAWSKPMRRKVKDAAPAVATGGGGPLGAIWLVLTAVAATLRKWHQHSAARRELAELDSRILRDIGMDPGARDHELRQPFWQPLRNWRDDNRLVG